MKNMFSGNIITFIDEFMVDMIIAPERMDKAFLFPERELFETVNPQYKAMFKNASRVFISHSSKDKEQIVNPLNSYLQANDIGTWLDSYEIDYGDNIYLKVNEGIENADLGLFILTDSFFDSASGWPLTEFSAFFMEMMKNNKKVLLVNAGVDESKLHALMKVYKYIMWDNGNGLPEIANAINRRLNA
ncbi:TPA: toll/interleukin-1 receptor domain-containing protein [Vibrio parahaemolyticus]|nr:toll/interleukin-1 receptor domain-containing protein [Vibrio parahaemolyticus]